MNKSMRAAIVRNKGGPFEIETVELAAPRDDEILVQIKAVGICHSDISCRDQVFPAKLPQIFGHEGAGVIIAVGNKVDSLNVGDHVLLTFNSCGSCANCEAGAVSHCYDFDNINASGGRADGSCAVSQNGAPIHAHFFGQSSFSEYVIARPQNAIRIAKDIDLSIAAPFACAVLTGAGCVINTLKPTQDSSVLILGCGGVGLSATMAAKHLGCKQIIVADLHRNRLDLAQKLGATHVIDASNENILNEVKKICTRGVDFSLECSAATGVQEVVVAALHSRGICALIGVSGMGARFDIPCYLLNVGRTVLGSVAGDCNPHTFLPKLLSLYQQGQFPVDRWIKHYPFANINQAADDLLSGATIKPVLVF